MQNFLASPNEMFRSFWRNRQLIKTLVVRDVLGRYRGSALGILWSFLNPVFMLAIYTFVFSVVLKARWNSGSNSKTEFALVLFAGLIVFNLFAESVNRAPGLILANVNYVKKVVFPLEILPWVSLGSSLFHMLISLVVWLLAYIVFYGMPRITVLYMPLILFNLVLFTMGISWILASLGVYIRDISQLIGMLTTVLMFLSPIFYSISSVPEKFQIFLSINPLTIPIEQMRDVLYWGELPSMTLWILSSGIAALVAWLGFAWFQKTRKGFSDVL